MEETPALEIRDLHCRIADFSILNGVRLKVAAGETLGIIGPNGSGKTTLFNTICGFAPVTQGAVLVKDSEVTRLPPFQRALKGLGRVFQNSGVFRQMTVLENIILALEGRHSSTSGILSGIWAPKLKEEGMTYLEQVGLSGKAHQKASSLSGGQLRLLEIVRVVAFGADVLLLDEPTAGVSPKMKDELIAQIAALKNSGKTVLIIEHDIHFIGRLCDRIAVLDLGQVVMEGLPEKVRQDARLQEIYFGSRQQ